MELAQCKACIPEFLVTPMDLRCKSQINKETKNRFNFLKRFFLCVNA
jgi:hypothetical protein